jgi:hypothetical protein
MIDGNLLFLLEHLVWLYWSALVFGKSSETPASARSTRRPGSA